MTQFAVQPGFIKKPGTDEEDVQQMKVRVAQIAARRKTSRWRSPLNV
ncbi:MAG: hypothetical protein HND47_20930 [Chloroflexi bacterium]|nr:hypothetical protein [Chloroflexota bacterium]